MSNPVVVIGGGHAAAQFVMSMRQEGYDGPLMMISDDIGLPYHKPPLSKAYLKTPDAEPQLLRPESFYTDKNVELRLETRVASFDHKTKVLSLDNGDTVIYSSLVLATGARPRSLPVTGFDQPGVFVLRTMQDARGLRAAAVNASNVVIIGGGFVGLEVASTLVAQGKKVTVFEAADRILGRAVAPMISDYLGDKLKESGVTILPETTVTRALHENGVLTGVETSSGETLKAELILIGIGVHVNSELAEEAGLDCDNGIRVDQRMRTSVQDVYAIGDCVNYDHWFAGRAVRLESVQNATDQARVLANVLNGGDKIYTAVPWFWSEIANCRLQMVGLSFDADDYILTGSTAENDFSVYHFAGDKLVSIDSINRAKDHMLGRKFFDSGFNPTKNDVKKGTAHLKELFAKFKELNA